MKNKKAQGLGLSIIVAIVIFIIGITCVSLLKPEITRARSAASLNCEDTANISDGTKLTCLVVSVVIPYFIVLILSLAGGLITQRFLI